MTDPTSVSSNFAGPKAQNGTYELRESETSTKLQQLPDALGNLSLGNVFQLFPLLPTELRLQIWDALSHLAR
jgi:hypothetical protein